MTTDPFAFSAIVIIVLLVSIMALNIIMAVMTNESPNLGCKTFGKAFMSFDIFGYQISPLDMVCNVFFPF